MQMVNSFTWISFYKECADRLAEWESRQGELIAFLEGLRAKDFRVTRLTDQDADGAHFLITELDPFTFFGAFNRGTRTENRVGIVKEVKKFLAIKAALPEDFDGIPILNNMSSWFIAYQYKRHPSDVARLWKVFRLALGSDPLNDPEFLKAFDEALEVRQTNLNLTMGLFWIRPETFLNLDQTNRTYLGIKLPPSGLSSKFYHDQVIAVRDMGEPLVQVSFNAWKHQGEEVKPDPALPAESNYWLAGAYWDSTDPSDQTERFLAEGIWQNGYEDRYLDDVKAMKVGDKIAIKSSSTQKNGLPFDGRGKTVSRMSIKAIGTVVANRKDGRTVEVEWDPSFKAKDWYFYTDRRTVWRLRRDDDLAKKLIDFVFGSDQQDYEWFCRKWWGPGEANGNETGQPPKNTQPYSVEDIIASGVFLTEPEIHQVLDRLRSKKNLILQGAPGVGKTFLARKLAYAMMEEKDDSRIQFVQFHQTYSYEDFIRGYRPLPDSGGTFGLQDGVFFDFCQRAQKDPERSFIFIIDEINRGNLSQILGELLMLLEADKRGPEYGMPLVYNKEGESRFFVPENLYVIGLMNLADRSLALVDYALRRRFSFMTLRAQFASPLFRAWLTERDMAVGLVELIVQRMTALNQEIAEEPLLGENYQVGHSFFCPKGSSFSGLDRTWYEAVVETEIAPLLREYWFDNPQRAEEARKQLLAK
jgi:5-methylcytosine-specific restriction enzyme B